MFVCHRYISENSVTYPSSVFRKHLLATKAVRHLYGSFFNIECLNTASKYVGMHFGKILAYSVKIGNIRKTSDVFWETSGGLRMTTTNGRHPAFSGGQSKIFDRFRSLPSWHKVCRRQYRNHKPLDLPCLSFFFTLT